MVKTVKNSNNNAWHVFWYVPYKKKLILKLLSKKEGKVKIIIQVLVLLYVLAIGVAAYEFDLRHKATMVRLERVELEVCKLRSCVLPIPDGFERAMINDWLWICGTQRKNQTGSKGVRTASGWI